MSHSPFTKPVFRVKENREAARRARHTDQLRQIRLTRSDSQANRSIIRLIRPPQCVPLEKQKNDAKWIFMVVFTRSS